MLILYIVFNSFPQKNTTDDEIKSLKCFSSASFQAYYNHRTWPPFLHLSLERDNKVSVVLYF